MITDIHLFYKDIVQEKEIATEFNKFYTIDDQAIVKRHRDELAASTTTCEPHIKRIKFLQETLSSFSSEKPFTKYGDPKLLHKSSMLYNIGAMRAAAVSQDTYNIKVEPATGGDELKVNDLNIVLKETMLKSKFSYNIKKLINASRLSTFSAMLIDFKKPEAPGLNEDVSQNRVEITQLDSNQILWDAAANSIEKSSYLYDLSKMGWFEIYHHPFLGKNKPLLDYLYEKLIKTNVLAKKQDFPEGSDLTNFDNVRKDNKSSSNITLYRKWVLRNKGLPNQECWIQYFIGRDIFLGQHKSHSSMIPVVILKEFDEPNAFYGASKVTQLLGKTHIYNELARTQDSEALDNVANLVAIAEEAGLDPVEIEYALNNPKGAYLILGSLDNRPLQNLIASININQLNPDALAHRERMRQEILAESGVSNLMAGDTNSMQTKSAMGRANVYTTIEMKATLPNITQAVYRACSIYVNYIINFAKTLDKNTELEIKKYETNPKNKGKEEYKMVKIKFNELRNVKVDIIPVVSLNPDLGQGQQLDILMQFLNLKAQGLIDIDLSFLVEALLGDVPFSQDMLRDIYVNKKKVVEAVVDQNSVAMEQYMSNPDDQRTPTEVLERQSDATMNAFGSPAGTDPRAAMEQEQPAAQPAPTTPPLGIDNQSIL